MAQSRLNKVSSIFTRLNGLLKSNIIPWTERPIWYDIYKAYPPIRDPTYRSIAGSSPDEYPNLPPKIFYEEDKVRAYYFKELGPIENQVLNSEKRKTIWDLFIDVYVELEKKGIEKKNLIDETCDEMLKRGYLIRKNKIKNSIFEQENLATSADNQNFHTKIEDIIKNLNVDKSQVT